MNTTNAFCLLPVFSVIFHDRNRVDQMIGRYRIPEARDKSVVFHEILKKLEEGNKNRNRIFLLQRPVFRTAISTAASLVLIFLLHFLLSATHIENDSSRVRVMSLPDRSRIVLDKNSTLSYPKYWWKRKIKLQGNAYFEVEKGKTFVVSTKEGNVSVLGTRFQVSEAGNGIMVDCYEGKVGLTTPEYIRQIPAGHSLGCINHQVTLLKPMEQDYPEIARFKRTFSGEELSKVTAALEEFFQISIRLAAAGSMRFSGNIETAEAETAVRIICLSLDLDYSFNSNKNIVINKKM